MNKANTQIKANQERLEELKKQQLDAEVEIRYVDSMLEIARENVEDKLIDAIDETLYTFIEKSILDVENLSMHLEDDGQTQTFAIPIQIEESIAKELLESVQMSCKYEDTYFEALIHNNINDSIKDNSEILITDLINNISKSIGLSEEYQTYLNKRIDKTLQEKMGISLNEVRKSLIVTEEESQAFKSLSKSMQYLDKIVNLHNEKMRTLEEINQLINSLSNEQIKLKQQNKIAVSVQTISNKVLETVENIARDTANFIYDVQNKINSSETFFNTKKYNALVEFGFKVLNKTSKTATAICANIENNFSTDYVSNLLLKYAEKDADKWKFVHDSLLLELGKKFGEDFVNQLKTDLSNINNEPKENNPPKFLPAARVKIIKMRD